MAERVAITAKKPDAKQKCPNFCKPKPGFNSSGSPAEILLNLQRTAGNQAVQKMIKSRALQEKPDNNHFGNIRQQRTYHILSQGMDVSQFELKKPLKEHKNEEEAKEVKTIGILVSGSMIFLNSIALVLSLYTSCLFDNTFF